MTMLNPYLDEFLGPAPVPARMAELRMDPFVQRVARHEHRFTLARRYSWAVPNDQAIELIGAHAPVTEIGAGTGYWSWLVQQTGRVHVPVDHRPPGRRRNRFHHRQREWTPVVLGDARTYRVPGRHALMLCWPDFRTDMSDVALRRYTGETLVYVGESAGGCTGSDEFHRMLNDHWAEHATMTIPQWEGVHDDLTVYRRRR